MTGETGAKGATAATTADSSGSDHRMRSALVCPACRSALREEDEAFECTSCRRVFPVVAGIPDLRLVPDRYLTFEEDRAKAVAIAREASGFADTVAAYWARTPEVPPELAARFSANTANGLARAQVYLDAVGALGCAPVGPADVVLDAGCGTGGLLGLAGSRGATVVGIDTALRWLVPARRFLEELGVPGLLVAADGATPPFRSGTFTVVTCIEVLEHAADQRGLVNACLGMADRPDGRCLLVAANRFSLVPEPAVRLWGVGWLPRRLQPRYVEARRHTSYRFTRPVSVAELGAFAGAGIRDDVLVGPAPLPPPPSDSGATRRVVQTAVEGALERLPALTSVAPLLALQRRAPAMARSEGRAEHEHQ